MYYHCLYKRARTPEQKQNVLDNLLKLWLKVPDQRLGQMIANYYFGCDFFFVEDYDFIGYLEHGLKEVKDGKKETK